MSERSRKKARRNSYKSAAQKVPPSQRPDTPAPLSKPRNKMRVAHAQQQLAQLRPDLLAMKRRTSQAVDRRPLADAQLEASPPPAPEQASRFAAARMERARSAQVSLEGANLDPGKCRPKDNTPKKGGGSSRDFHLWKKTC